MKDFILDTDRFHRQCFPEAVYCSGKTINQILAIVKELLSHRGEPIILTRVTPEIYRAVKNRFKKIKYHKLARLITISANRLIAHSPPSPNRYVAVVTAGTSDIPVAEEAAVVAETLGNNVRKIYDVGVAGIHRLFKFEKIIKNASCVVVCAGMEGALSSVVGGLVSKVVIGVPTSTGYGTGKGGYSALLTMLNSCSPNVCVVNIDNGFGAGVIASIINKNPV
ncbi:MAG: nickel pincer cofactor biosynthesis protein LarB [Elusimicrobiota bacterium]